jgi:hypothetical protein
MGNVVDTIVTARNSARAKRHANELQNLLTITEYEWKETKRNLEEGRKDYTKGKVTREALKHFFDEEQRVRRKYKQLTKQYKLTSKARDTIENKSTNKETVAIAEKVFGGSTIEDVKSVRRKEDEANTRSKVVDDLFDEEDDEDNFEEYLSVIEDHNNLKLTRELEAIKKPEKFVRTSVAQET